MLHFNLFTVLSDSPHLWNPKRAHGLVRIPRWARLIVVSYLERVDTSYRKRADIVAIPVDRVAIPVDRTLQSVHFSLTFARVTNPVGRSFAAHH